MSQKTDDEIIADYAYVLRRIITPVSLMGAIFMFISCLAVRPMTISIKFIAVLALSDIFYSVSGAMSMFQYDRNSVECRTEAIMNSFFFNLSTFMASSIAVLRYKLTNYDVKFNQKLFFQMTLLIGLSACSFFSLWILVNDDLGIIQLPEGSCYEEYKEGGTRAVEILYRIYADAPIYGGLLVSIIFYYRATRLIKKVSLVLLNKTDVQMYALMLYPLVLCVTLTPYLVLTFSYHVFGMHTPPALVLLNFVATRSIGFANAVTYGVQRKIYRNMMKKREHALMSVECRSSCSMVSLESQIFKRTSEAPNI